MNKVPRLMACAPVCCQAVASTVIPWNFYTTCFLQINRLRSQHLLENLSTVNAAVSQLFFMSIYSATTSLIKNNWCILLSPHLIKVKMYLYLSFGRKSVEWCNKWRNKGRNQVIVKLSKYLTMCVIANTKLRILLKRFTWNNCF